jgi:hypothetical protein
MKNECLTTEIKRAFLAYELSIEQREMAETHLAACRACRRQLANLFSEGPEIFSAPDSLKQKAKQIPPQEKRNFFAAFLAYFQQPVSVAATVVLLVAVSVIAFFVFREMLPTQNSQQEKFRKGNNSSNKLQLLSPDANAQISNEQIEFRWAEAANAKDYTLIVLDEKGDIVAQQTTNQESFSLNASSLEKGKSYFWFVKVKFPDGTTIDSNAAKFVFVK